MQTVLSPKSHLAIHTPNHHPSNNSFHREGQVRRAQHRRAGKDSAKKLALSTLFTPTYSEPLRCAEVSLIYFYKCYD